MSFCKIILKEIKENQNKEKAHKIYENGKDNSKWIEGDFLTVSSVTRVKEIVESCVGQRVKYKIRKGKSKSQIGEGIIVDTYPSVFTVYVEKKEFKRVVSFNYIDILTNHVEFTICDEKETRIV